MSIGGSGQSGNQSSSQNSAFSGKSESTSTPTAPNGWQDLWKSIAGMGGQTPQQAQAGGYFSNQVGTNPTGAALGRINDTYLTDASNFSAPTLHNMSFKYGDIPEYQAPTPVTAATSANPLTVNPGTAASFMDPYRQGYTNDVVNATTADLANQYGKAQNASNMAGTAAGGIANSRMGLRDAQTTDDFLRTLATTTGGLRDAGFSRAIGAGQGDAGLNLTGQQANQAAELSNSQFNAANNIDAQKFNNTLLNNRQQFDSGTALNTNAQRLNSIQQMTNSDVTANSIAGGNASQLGNLGGMNFGQLLQGLAAGTPLFGSTSTNTGSGTSSGTSSGSSSSKGGGAGFKIPGFG